MLYRIKVTENFKRNELLKYTYVHIDYNIFDGAFWNKIFSVVGLLLNQLKAHLFKYTK